MWSMSSGLLLLWYPLQSSSNAFAPPQFKCNFCPKMFVQKQNRDDHMNIHTGAKPFECEQCDETFACLSNLIRHRERHHSNARNYKCKTCKNLFKTSSNLWSHIRHTHSAPQFEWPFCQQKFARSSSCLQHWNGSKRRVISCKVRLNQIAKQKSNWWIPYNFSSWRYFETGIHHCTESCRFKLFVSYSIQRRKWISRWWHDRQWWLPIGNITRWMDYSIDRERWGVQ